MSSIVVVVYLVAVAEVQSKWLLILEFPEEGLTIPSLVFLPHTRFVELFECHPGGHNLHDILWFFEAKDIECLTSVPPSVMASNISTYVTSLSVKYC